MTSPEKNSRKKSGKKLKREKKVGKKNINARKKSGKKLKREKKVERRKIEHNVGMALTGLRSVLIQRTRFCRRFNQFMIGSSLK